MLGSVLLLAGLLVGRPGTIVHSFELLALGLLGADAWGLRQRIPVLKSKDKAVAAGGWVLLTIGFAALALAIP